MYKPYIVITSILPAHTGLLTYTQEQHLWKVLPCISSCCTQAAEAQERLAAWQQDVQQQQASVQAALSLVQHHLQSSIQACKLKLAQLQQWLMRPTKPHQQEALASQLQEAEQQLVQFRREARKCELEAQRVAHLSVPPGQDKFTTQASVSNTAGPSSPISTSSNLTLGFGAMDSNSTAQHSSNGTPPSGASLSIKEGLETQPVSAAPGSGWATSNTVGQEHAGSAPGTQASRGRSLWQPVGGASSSTSSAVPLASAVARLPSR